MINQEQEIELKDITIDSIGAVLEEAYIACRDALSKVDEAWAMLYEFKAVHSGILDTDLEHKKNTLKILLSSIQTLSR